MTQINNQQPNHVSPQYSSSHSKQQSSPTGTELGQDTISLSKEFAKGTSSGSVGALSNAKKSAKAEQDQKQTEATRATDDTKRVTPTKTISASQAHTGIKSQTETQQSMGPASDKHATNQPLLSPQALKTCPYCKGNGCDICNPTLIDIKTQVNKSEMAQALNDQKRRINAITRIKAMINQLLKILKPTKLELDSTIDNTNRHKKRNINTYADHESSTI